jgi:HEAT repeat protein
VAKTDPSISVRERVLFALSQVPENRGIPGLIAVARSDANVNLRTKAIHFLGMSKDPRARAALLDIAREAK